MKNFAANLVTYTLARAPYALIVSGDQLTPTYADGATVAIVPAVLSDPDKIAPGTVVLASVESADRPGLYEGAGLFRMNADGDLTTNRLTVPRHQYLLLGYVSDTLTHTGNDESTARFDWHVDDFTGSADWWLD